MILFKKIKWKNVLSTGNIFTEIDLSGNKAVLIVGENGAGKSTILDALSFCLYGKPFRNINKGQLVNSINKKDMVVEAEFAVGKKEYRVTRGIKPTVFEIYCNDQLLDQDAESKDYQEMFEKQILKLNHKSFNQIVVLGSASFVPFMQLKTADRREIIEDLLDIEIFSKMNILLKDKIQQNKTDSVSTSYAVRSNKDKIELHESHIESLKQNNDELVNQKNTKIKEFKAKIIELNKATATINTTIERLSKLVQPKEATQKKLSKFSLLQSKIDDKMQKLEGDIEFFENHDNCPTCKQQIDSLFKTSTLDTKNKHREELNEGITKLGLEIVEIEDIIKQYLSVEKEISQHNVNYTQVLNQISNYNNWIESLEVEIEDLKGNTKQININSDEITKLKKELEDNEKELTKLQTEKQVFDVAALLLKDTGIKTRIIKQYVPIMNKLINKYLAAMDFFVNFELNENFEEKIKSRFRDEFSYASFSEGEKMRIDLALLFTWRSIAKLRNSTSTNLLIMDEVFDSSLDGAGTEEFMKILNNLTQDTNTFIISHKGDQLADKFTNILKFEKHKNFSRMIT